MRALHASLRGAGLALSVATQPERTDNTKHSALDLVSYSRDRATTMGAAATRASRFPDSDERALCFVCPGGGWRPPCCDPSAPVHASGCPGDARL